MSRWRMWSYLLVSVALYGCLSLFLLRRPGSHNLAHSYFFQVSPPWLAFVGCGIMVRRHASQPLTRFYWCLFALALFFWSVGMSLEAWADLKGVHSNLVAGYSDLAYSLYGLPILLVIASPIRGDRPSIFLWLDSIQAVMTGALVYVALFRALPFLHQQEPVAAAIVARAYNIENLFLACGVSLRLLTLTERGTLSWCFRIMACFLWLYAIFLAIYNRLFIVLQGAMGVYDVLSAVPFLVLLLLLAYPTPEERTEGVPDLLDRPVRCLLRMPALSSTPSFYLCWRSRRCASTTSSESPCWRWRWSSTAFG